MGVDLIDWRRRIAAFPNLGLLRRRKRRMEDGGLTKEGQWWRMQIVVGFATLAVGLCLSQTAPLCPYIVAEIEPEHSINPTQTVPNVGTHTNHLVFLVAPHLLLLRGGDVEVNPGPGKISWDEDKIIGRSSGTPTSSEWVFTQKQENEALKKQSEEEAEKQKADRRTRVKIGRCKKQCFQNKVLVYYS